MTIQISKITRSTRTALMGIAVSAAVAGCASGLNSVQEREYAAFEAGDVLVKEKSPGAGVALGFLPGGGSFYAREPGIGVVNLLLWPLSIFWDPVSGYNGAKAINYDLTRHKVKKDREHEIGVLDDKLAAGEIDSKQYVLEKNRIERKYDFE